MDQEELMTTKLGCFTHSSDFGFGGRWGLPGFHWLKNYTCFKFTVARPSDGTRKVKITCPVCSKQLILKVPSNAVALRKRVAYGVIGFALTCMIYVLWIFDYGALNLDDSQALTLRIWGTIFIIPVALNSLANAGSPWFCFVPKLKKDLRFKFWGHKLTYFEENT